jgi:hypothetical protein
MTVIESANRFAARARRVIAGEGMLTPVEPLSFDGEALTPGRDRLSPDHPAVSQRPEWFRPADRKDTDTAARHRATLEREARSIRAGGPRQPGRPGKPSGYRLPSSTRLPKSRPTSWRLP